MLAKRVAITVCVVLAIGVATATAGAAEWHIREGGVPPENISATGKDAIFESTIAGVKVIINCASMKTSGGQILCRRWIEYDATSRNVHDIGSKRYYS